MPTLFIHGVTVREPHFTPFVEDFARRLQRYLPGETVRGFYWGGSASRLRLGGKSIPEFDGRRAVGAPAPVAVAEDVGLDFLLLEDPLVELRLLEDEERFDPHGAGLRPVPPEVERRNERLSAAIPSVRDRLLARPAVRDLTDGDSQAVARVVQQVLEEGGRAQRELDVNELIDPMTRALTASLYRATGAAERPFGLGFPWPAIEESVESALEDALGGERGLLGDAARAAAMRALTQALRAGLRERATAWLSVFLGDAFVYLNRRDPILGDLESRARELLRESPGPLRVVGHSMGGNIAYDFCVRAGVPVDSLVTVGTQVGFLEELSVLTTRAQPAADGRVDSPLPAGRWLNIYDLNDAFSFLVEPVVAGARDLLVDTRAPFPLSHSAYWVLDRVYAEIAAHIGA